jgi:DNA-directed RNA polymerase subunit RPC12/RpoP
MPNRTKSCYEDLVNYSVKATRDNNCLVFNNRTISVDIVENIYIKYIGLINETGLYHCSNCSKEVKANLTRNDHKQMVLKCSLCKRVLMKARLRYAMTSKDGRRLE